MTGNRTATVETLAAEVRVLMVGSRQVTLSVYAQLDLADYATVDPFGRVRPRDAILDYLYLVGRHRETGALVRCRVPGGPESIGSVYGWGGVARSIELRQDKMRRCRAERDRYLKFESDSHDKLPGSHSCMVEEIRKLEEQFLVLRGEAVELSGAYKSDTADAVALAARLNELPLIVLAGLR